MKTLNRSSLKSFEIAMISIVIIALLTAGPAFARISANTIDDPVILSSNNKHILVTGPIQCTKGDKLSIDVILTQRETQIPFVTEKAAGITDWTKEETGAIAKGKLETSCTGTLQQWKINTDTEGRFNKGTAKAWALAITRNHRKITDVDQWSREVAVVKLVTTG
jgi:hypothetical protein